MNELVIGSKFFIANQVDFNYFIFRSCQITVFFLWECGFRLVNFSKAKSILLWIKKKKITWMNINEYDIDMTNKHEK